MSAPKKNIHILKSDSECLNTGLMGCYNGLVYADCNSKTVPYILESEHDRIVDELKKQHIFDLEQARFAYELQTINYERQIEELRCKPCKFYMAGTDTSMRCANCGKQKIEH